MISTSASEAVHLDGVVKEFGRGSHRVRAVDGVDLSIGRGEVVAFLGPNGAGKTTTLDMVLGLTAPSAGTARVHGLSPREAVLTGRVSGVLQSGGLLRDLSVGETVTMIASTFRNHARVAEVIRRADLEGMEKRKVSKLSGGEQQRLRFALALLPDPDLLILDEPTAGMDVSTRRQFWDTMRADADNGRTVVFATHYLEEADTFAERIIMIAGGRIVADGSTAQIRARATGRTVTARLDGPHRATGLRRLRSLDGVSAVHEEGPRVRVHAADSDAVARALLGELGGSDLEITTGSLDDAFTTLTSAPGAGTVSQIPAGEASR
ncbi:ABC transporter ATP-binding protein [Bogoriella caseilytica]|uniref:ABC-2 type transport system ATP-binding protein n=1 Tax=Bogoriella caseilytica TaxID=56055 RepID=A0A3N2BB42_9MICO|nr:ABC transporter ATP-binding protein [Bogoriella caseilytica]ROR72479.1 ABC-2 type transport system ATP-binding protein [Bogoriella caseilytica]